MAEGPQNRERRRVETQYLRVPKEDWAAVKHGYKTEYRLGGRGGMYLNYLSSMLPTPVVLYMTAGNRHEHKLGVLTDCWIEPLGAISEESVQLEGFTSVAHFRRYWTSRTSKRFRPLERVQVFRVRPFTPEDRESLGGILFDRLFGEFTGADTERSLVSRRGPISASLR